MFVLKLYADTNLDQFTKLKFWCLSVVSFSFRSQEQRLKAHSLGTYRCINKILYLMYLWCILSFQSQQKRLNVHSLGTAMPKFRHLWPSATLATMWTGQCTNSIETNSLTLTSLFSVLLSDVHVGHSCKTGNVRYGGTSKTQNWNDQTFDNFVLKFFHTYVIQLEINYGPPLSTFFSPIMEEYNILDVPP